MQSPGWKGGVLTQVAEESGRIKDGKVEEFQVRLKIGFKIER